HRVSRRLRRRRPHARHAPPAARRGPAASSRDRRHLALDRSRFDRAFAPEQCGFGSDDGCHAVSHLCRLLPRRRRSVPSLCLAAVWRCLRSAADAHSRGRRRGPVRRCDANGRTDERSRLRCRGRALALHAACLASLRAHPSRGTRGDRARRGLRAGQAGGLSPGKPLIRRPRQTEPDGVSMRPSVGGAQMSDAFDRFRYSFFEDPTSARDGLDIASLRAIEDYERGEAERLLLAFLPDARAVIGLGVLRSAKAEVELSRLFDTERKQQIDARNDPAMQPGGSNEWYPSAMLYLAQALWRIRPEPRWPQAVIEVLASARDWVFRHEAVLVLAGIGEPDAVEALVNAFDDEEPLVRH